MQATSEEIQSLIKAIKLSTKANIYQDLIPRDTFVWLTSERTYRKIKDVANTDPKYKDLVMHGVDPQTGVSVKNTVYINRALYEQYLMEQGRKRNNQIRDMSQAKLKQERLKEQGIIKRNII